LLGVSFRTSSETAIDGDL